MKPATDAALEKFIIAAHDLLEQWEESLDEGYPSCLPSFDEFCFDLCRWREKASAAKD